MEQLLKVPWLKAKTIEQCYFVFSLNFIEFSLQYSTNQQIKTPNPNSIIIQIYSHKQNQIQINTSNVY